MNVPIKFKMYVELSLQQCNQTRREKQIFFSKCIVSSISFNIRLFSTHSGKINKTKN